MIYTLKTAPAVSPVHLEEAKAHLRVSGAGDDAYISSIVEAATSIIENMTSNRFVPQTWTAYLTSFPSDSKIVLPFGKVISVASVKYTNYAGAITTFSSANYTVDTVSSPGKIDLAYEVDWPSDIVLQPVNGIAVEFVSGYTSVPVEIKQAILLMISHLYENREPFLVSMFGKSSVAAIPLSIDALIAEYRMSWGF